MTPTPMPDSPRPADAALRARVCGVDCHPGDALCNGSCTGAAEAPPTSTDDRTPLQRAVERVRDGAEGIGNGARLTARECSALRARLSETREAGEELERERARRRWAQYIHNYLGWGVELDGPNEGRCYVAAYSQETPYREVQVAKVYHDGATDAENRDALIARAEGEAIDRAIEWEKSAALPPSGPSTGEPTP